MGDEEIVELYLHRDEAAIEATEERYGNRIRTLALRIVGDLPTAEECENDTYLELWKVIPPNEPRDYFYAFLACITRHIALNRCKERSALKRHAYISELSDELEECIPALEDVESSMDELALKEAINGFLGTLNSEKRSIFLRRYWYMDSVREVAERYGISESKVKTMLFRLRTQFKNYLEKEGYIL